MLNRILLSSLMALGGVGTAQAQQCLHGPLETAAERTRREQAIDFARRVNAAQHAPAPFRAPGAPRYRPLDELRYRWLRWRMGRARSKFDVYSGGKASDEEWKREWKKHIH